MKTRFLPLFLLLLAVTPAAAAPISIFAAPDQYQNGGVNPCIFSGNGNNGCNQADFPFPAWVSSTQQFDTNPLINNIGDAPNEINQFAANIGKSFFIGFDENQAGNKTQSISNLTITFKDTAGNTLGNGYTLGNTPVSLDPLAQGEGYTDYVFSAGCLGTVGGGTGVLATCTQYAPFLAPAGTRDIIFTYGMEVFNDGAERLFLIKSGPTPTPFDEPPGDPIPTPEPASMLLLGSGLLGVARYAKKRKPSVA